MVDDERASVGRAVRTEPDGARTVVVRRTYDADVTDVWDCLTNPERLPRWFLPVTGDFQIGGRFQVEGNAGGEILACEPPRRLRVTWVFGEGEDGFSEVEVRLTDDGDRTVFELEHSATVDPERWERFGPGAVGVGWDLALLGLTRHLTAGASGFAPGPEWGETPEARAYMTASSEAWGVANVESGADPAAADSAVKNTTAFYVPS